MNINLSEKWFKIPQIFRYLVVGIFNAAVAYIVFCILVFIFGEKYRQICLAAQWVLTSYISFLTQRTFVFQSRGNKIHEYSKCLLSWTVGYIVNAVMLEVFFRLNINVYISQIFAIGISSLCTFVLLKYWALIKKKKD